MSAFFLWAACTFRVVSSPEEDFAYWWSRGCCHRWSHCRCQAIMVTLAHAQTCTLIFLNACTHTHACMHAHTYTHTHTSTQYKHNTPRHATNTSTHTHNTAQLVHLLNNLWRWILQFHNFWCKHFELLKNMTLTKGYLKSSKCLTSSPPHDAPSQDLMR